VVPRRKRIDYLLGLLFSSEIISDKINQPRNNLAKLQPAAQRVVALKMVPNLIL
jgi:hypothetical protein